MWIDLLEHWLGLQDAAQDEAARRLGRACDRLSRTDAPGCYPYLATLLSLPVDSEAARQIAQMDPEALRQRTFRAVQGWIEAMILEGPLVLSFDDVYWADSTSLQLLEYCLPLCDRHSVLFLVMFRARLRSAVWEFQQRVEKQYLHRITKTALEPLSADESAQMVDALVGPDALPGETQEQIVTKAEGNPYYLEEIIRSLIREGVLTQDEAGDWHLARDIEELDLPDTLRGLLSAQIDDLSMAERHVLQVAALIGDVFWRKVLDALVGKEVDLDACLTALQRARLVRERGEVPDLGMEYGFRSGLLREVACDTLLLRQRTAYAQRAADYMAQLFGEEVLTRYYDIVAHLYRAAKDHRRELFYTLSAAEHAQSIYANEEALALYRRALELIDQLGAGGEDGSADMWRDWRIESLIGAGRILLGTGQPDQAEPYLRQAVDLAERSEVSAREQARLYYWLCEALFWLGRYEEQLEMAQRGLALVEGEGPSVEMALMNQEIAVGSLQLGQPDTYREFTQRTARFLESLPYAEELRPAYDHVASLYVGQLREPEEAMRWLLALRERAERHQDLRALAQSHDYAGLVLMATGDLQRAVEEHRQALGLCERVGDALQELDATRHLVDAFLALGDLGQAEEFAKRSLETASGLGSHESLAWAYWSTGRAMHASKAWDDALQWFQKAATMFESEGAPSRRAMMMYHVAAVQLHKGERAVAVRTFEEAAELAGPRVLAENPLSLALVLTAIESAAGDGDAFVRFRSRWEARLPSSTLGQWSLEPAEPAADEWPALSDGELSIEPEGPWVWVDPLGGSNYRVSRSLSIEAPNGRGLSESNLSAPRLVWPVRGECALQAVCAAGEIDQPALGGLVLWCDRNNFLRLLWGFGGPGGLAFGGFVGGEQALAGRGWLRDCQEQVHLRMECDAGGVRALCSPDGVQWYRVGQTNWDPDRPVQIGMYASGDIDRLVYPGAFPEGTAVRFHSVRLWGAEPPGGMGAAARQCLPADAARQV
jgi:tetratricopeptide (TPR) repeat protein